MRRLRGVHLVGALREFEKLHAAREVVRLRRPEGCELAVVFGGDGTILRAAEVCRGTGTPLLGVNLGHVGFLAEADEEDLEDVARHYGGAPLLFPGMGHDLMLDARWQEPIDAIIDWLDKVVR